MLLNKCVSCGYINTLLIAALGLFIAGIYTSIKIIVLMLFSHCGCDCDSSNSSVFYNFAIMAPSFLILFAGNRV